MRPQNEPHERKPSEYLLRLLLLFVLVEVALLLLRAAKADAEETGYSAFVAKAQEALVKGDLSPVKRDLFQQALAHQTGSFRAFVVHYHPREAGGGWRRWSHTATGTLVRPGVASCTVAHRTEWMGAWVWFEGLGVHHVEDCFPESSSRTMFDVASPEAYPGQTYEDWLSDFTRIQYALTVSQRRTAVVLKPRGGWNQ